MEDFNLSDMELSHEIDCSEIGIRRTIASIIEKSAVDRVKSEKKLNELEKKLKKLEGVAISPGQELQTKEWYDLFTTFAKHTLQIGSRPK